MNPSNLPPQGRYSDPRVQQMVIDELRSKDITPEKFYFTSDDWMVSYDGQVPAWNSVFGVAPYRKDGQTYYAECGVSQRYDPNTAQWGEPAATVKEGLQLSEAEFEAAPGALGADSSAMPAQAGDFGGQPGGQDRDAGQPHDGNQQRDAGQNDFGPSGDRGPDHSRGQDGDAGQPREFGGQTPDGAPHDSSSTVLASSLPDVGSQESAADQPNDGLGGFAAGAADEGAQRPDANAGQQSEADPWVADARPAAHGDDDQRAAELATHPAGEEAAPSVVSSGAAAGVAGAAGGAVAGLADAGSEQRDEPRDETDGARDANDWRGANDGAHDGVDLSGSADLGRPDDEVNPSSQSSPRHAQLADDEADVPSYEAGAAAEAASHLPEGAAGGGSAIYGGDAIHPQDRAYDASSTGNQANVAGYALTVKDDGTAELQVPLGGQVTLRWAGQ